MGDIRWNDVASLYDAYVTVDFDVPFFVAEAEKAAGEVLELMAGTGRVSLPLVEAGARLTCLDSSEEMLAVLRRKLSARGLHATVAQADARNFDLGHVYDLAILPFNSFSELVEPDAQASALASVHCHLRPGGRFICTLHNPGARRRTVDGQPRLEGSYPLADGTLLLWSTARFAAGGQVVEGVQVYQEYAADGVLKRQRKLEMRFALIERHEFEQRAFAAGFSLQSLYGDYDRSPFDPDRSPYMIWLLERPPL